MISTKENRVQVLNVEDISSWIKEIKARVRPDAQHIVDYVIETQKGEHYSYYGSNMHALTALVGGVVLRKNGIGDFSTGKWFNKEVKHLPCTKTVYLELL